jgi:hypothetical protein
MRRIAIAALVALAAGCGGDDGLSPDEYRSQARQICNDARRATRTVEQPTRTTNAAIADYFSRLLSVNERTAKRFGALEPPEDLKDAHDEALRANRDAVTEVRRLVAELREGGDATELLQGAQGRLTDLASRSRAAAQRLRVPECAREE